MNADEALGEIISWFGHGILDMTVENMTDEQMKNMVKIFNTHPDYYVHDQDYELDVKNPSQFNPKEFFNVFNSNIAAAAEMPTHILTGESIGDVTGSEVNVSDYYNDIANIQEIVFTPILISVYKQLLESNNIRWKYKIDWNPVFVDELSEAKIYQTRAYAASQLFNAGIIDIKEARFIMNEGFTVLDVGKDIKKKDVDGSVVDQPNVAPQPVVKPKSFKVPLTAEQCEMIAKAEHELGLRELYEQDKRLDEAKKRLKNAK